MCNFGRGHYGERSCEIIQIKFGTVVQVSFEENV